MSDGDIKFEEGKSTTWRRTGDIRQLVAVQGPQMLGPLLQEAWQCDEDGSIRWQRIPIHSVSVAEYTTAAVE